MRLVAFICLSLSKITQKCVNEILRVDMDELINF